MKKLRGEEIWAQRVIESALGVPVRQHDDGSRPSMHDLVIEYAADLSAAVEVTAAADPESIELWNLVNGDGRWTEDDLKGGWMISLLPSARAKRVRSELPTLLARLESSGISSLSARRSGALAQVASDLRITRAHQSDTDFPGSIYITLELPAERSGGMVPDTGDPLALWIGEFLAETKQADVRSKLVMSGCDERHAFVYLPGFASAPFGVTDVLMRDDAPLPRTDPILPTEVTHVWAMSSWKSGTAFFWSPAVGWRQCRKLLE